MRCFPGTLLRAAVLAGFSCVFLSLPQLGARLHGRSRPRILRTSEVRLIAPDGHVSGLLSCATDSFPSLCLKTRQQQVRLGLGFTRDREPSIDLFGVGGRAALNVLQRPHPACILLASDAQDKTRAQFGLSPEGFAGVALRSSNADFSASCGVLEDGTATLRIRQPEMPFWTGLRLARDNSDYGFVVFGVENPHVLFRQRTGQDAELWLHQGERQLRYP